MRDFLMYVETGLAKASVLSCDCFLCAMVLLSMVELGEFCEAISLSRMIDSIVSQAVNAIC